MIKTNVSRLLKTVFLWVLLIHAGYLCIIALCSIYISFFNPPVFSLMSYRLCMNGITPKKQFNAATHSIPRRYLNLIVSMEDPLFYQHNGIDIDSMRNAARVNHRYKKIISGASTIDQQLARTLFLIPDKLYVRKYLEVIAAVIMDAVIPKERILELYVNYAEWGRGIYGINSASWYYYKKPVSSCSDDQAVRLITVLPSPVLYSPFDFERRERLNTRYYRLLEALGYN